MVSGQIQVFERGVCRALVDVELLSNHILMPWLVLCGARVVLVRVVSHRGEDQPPEPTRANNPTWLGL